MRVPPREHVHPASVGEQLESIEEGGSELVVLDFVSEGEGEVVPVDKREDLVGDFGVADNVQVREDRKSG